MMKNDTRQGYFVTSQTQDNATTSSIGRSVSIIGVPQSAQDLETYEHQLVVQSIKQDLRAALQRQAPTHADVDLKVFMQHGAPRELKDILQGLVYVAKIKDVANTRGGAQVSQHRRVLAQQTYNMLVQELGDMLQGQAVQSWLRALTTVSDTRPGRNNPKNQAVQSNAELSTLHGGMKRDMPELDTNTLSQVKRQNDDEMSRRGSSVVSSLVGEYMYDLDVEQSDVELKQNITEIEQAREQDDAKTQNQIQSTNESLNEESDVTKTKNLNQRLRLLNNITEQRQQTLERYANHVEKYNYEIQHLRKRINDIKETKGTLQTEVDLYELETEIKKVNDEHRLFITTIKESLKYLREKDEAEMD